MTFVGSVNVMVNGRVVTVPVTKVMYQNQDEARPAGGVVEADDGSMQIMLDARLSEDDAGQVLETHMAEVSRRVVSKFLN